MPRLCSLWRFTNAYSVDSIDRVIDEMIKCGGREYDKKVYLKYYEVMVNYLIELSKGA